MSRMLCATRSANTSALIESTKQAPVRAGWSSAAGRAPLFWEEHTMKTHSPGKVRVRIAQMIREQLQQLQRKRISTVHRQAGTLLDQVDRIRAGRRKLAICMSRGWSAATTKTVRSIGAALRDVPYHVTNTQQALEARQTKVPTVREIADEVRQLEDEFTRVDCNPSKRTVSVVTEPIELEGIYLGPFEVRLHIDRMASDNPQASFDVVALDSHPAAPNNVVTHPHVSDEQMCCGDASLPIKAAVEEGRLSDLFCLVRSVLETYNSDSPYVALNNWHGRPCHDCGYTLPEDEGYWCSSCERDFCDECSSCCGGCDETTCGECLSQCPTCDDRYCAACITTCPDCGETICRTCLENEQCPCIEEREQENEDDQEEDEAENSTNGTGEQDGEADERARTEAA